MSWYLPLGQPRQGSIHHGAVGGRVLAGCVEGRGDSFLGNQFLEPVEAGDCGAQPGTVRGREEIVLRPGAVLVIFQVQRRPIAEVRPRAGEEHGVSGREIGRRPAVHGGRCPACAQLGQERHRVRLERGVLAQRVHQHEDDPAAQRSAGRRARCRRLRGQRRPVGVQRVHLCGGPEIGQRGDGETGDHAYDEEPDRFTRHANPSFVVRNQVSARNLVSNNELRKTSTGR